MKKIFVSILIIICFSCANETKVSNYTKELNELRVINDKLIKSNPEDIASIYQLGVKIKNTSLNLYVRYNQFFSDEEKGTIHIFKVAHFLDKEKQASGNTTSYFSVLSSMVSYAGSEWSFA